MTGMVRSAASGLGGLLMIAGYLSGAIFGLWGFYVECVILHHVWGFFGVVLGIMLLPVALAAAPIYALIEFRDATPLLIIYGGGFVSFALLGTGLALAKAGD